MILFPRDLLKKSSYGTDGTEPPGFWATMWIRRNWVLRRNWNFKTKHRYTSHFRSTQFVRIHILLTISLGLKILVDPDVVDFHFDPIILFPWWLTDGVSPCHHWWKSPNITLSNGIIISLEQTSDLCFVYIFIPIIYHGDSLRCLITGDGNLTTKQTSWLVSSNKWTQILKNHGLNSKENSLRMYI